MAAAVGPVIVEAVAATLLARHPRVVALRVRARARHRGDASVGGGGTCREMRNAARRNVVMVHVTGRVMVRVLVPVVRRRFRPPSIASVGV